MYATSPQQVIKCIQILRDSLPENYGCFYCNCISMLRMWHTNVSSYSTYAIRATFKYLPSRHTATNYVSLTFNIEKKSASFPLLLEISPSVLCSNRCHHYHLHRRFVSHFVASFVGFCISHFLFSVESVSQCGLLCQCLRRCSLFLNKTKQKKNNCG